MSSKVRQKGGECAGYLTHSPCAVGEVVGELTSVISVAPGPGAGGSPKRLVGLGYILSRHAAGADARFTLRPMGGADWPGLALTLRDPPAAFPKFDVSAAAAAPAAKVASRGREVLLGAEAALGLTTGAGVVTGDPSSPAPQQSAEEKRRADKLRALAERVSALQQAKKAGP